MAKIDSHKQASLLGYILLSVVLLIFGIITLGTCDGVSPCRASFLKDKNVKISSRLVEKFHKDGSYTMKFKNGLKFYSDRCARGEYDSLSFGIIQVGDSLVKESGEMMMYIYRESVLLDSFDTNAFHDCMKYEDKPHD